MGVTINQLPLLSDLSSSDQFIVYYTSGGDARRIPASTLLDWIETNIQLPASQSYNFTTQYASPSSTGFSVTITDGASDNTNVHLILTPTAGFAAGTIVLPVNTSLSDKQEVLVNCTQQVTTLTINGNGATVTGEPATLAADAFFRLKYDQITNVWYRVG